MKVVHVDASNVVPSLMASQLSENIPKKVVGEPPVTVIAQLPTHSFGMLQNQPKRRSLSNPLENQLAVG